MDATIDSYLSDLHQAVLHPDVGVWTYRYCGRPYAGFMAPSHIQNVPRPLPYLFVAYDPQFGTITTGYQASGHAIVFDRNCSVIQRHR